MAGLGHVHPCNDELALFEPAAEPDDLVQLPVGDDDGQRHDSPDPSEAPGVLNHERLAELSGEVFAAVRRGDLWVVKDKYLTRKQIVLLGAAPDAELAQTKRELDFLLGVMSSSLYFAQAGFALGHKVVHLQDRCNNQLESVRRLARQHADNVNRIYDLQNELLQQAHAANNSRKDKL